MDDIDAGLRAQFGLVMSTAEVAEALKMSVSALRMARSRKRLAIKPLSVEGRRGQVYNTADVAQLLMAWMSKPAEEPM